MKKGKNYNDDEFIFSHLNAKEIENLKESMRKNRKLMKQLSKL